MAGRKKKKPDSSSSGGQPESPSQALQVTKKTDWIEAEYVEVRSENQFRNQTRRRMNRFLRAYEMNGGNVTLSAAQAGVSRRAFYRWAKGNLPIHHQFRKKLDRIKPDEVIVDRAEAAMMHNLNDNNVVAAIFTLKTKGRSRGWAEQDRSMQEVSALTKAVDAFRLWLMENPAATQDERNEWLEMFALRLGVNETDVRRELALREYTARAK